MAVNSQKPLVEVNKYLNQIHNNWVECNIQDVLQKINLFRHVERRFARHLFENKKLKEFLN